MRTDPKDVIARRVAQELRDGDRVNLGIGLPTLVASHLPSSIHVFFHSENGRAGRAGGRRTGSTGQLDGAGQDGSWHGRRNGLGDRSKKGHRRNDSPLPGRAKLVKQCTLPITSIRRVDLVVTELAVSRPTPHGLELVETAPGVTIQEVLSATEAKLHIPANL